MLDPEIGQFADVHQAVLARENLDETAEFFDRDNLAAIDFADLDFRGHALDRFARNLHPFGGDGVNFHRAVVFDVDFAARFLDDAFDILAAGADQLADSFRIDLQRNDARRVFAQVRPRRRQRLRHFLQYGQTRHPGSLHSFRHQFVGQAGQFEIELETGDAFFGAGDLAIHVAKRVLPADDVGEQLIP